MQSQSQVKSSQVKCMDHFFLAKFTKKVDIYCIPKLLLSEPENKMELQ